MLQFFLSSWRAGFRSRSFYAVSLLGIALVVVAYLASSFSPRQPQTVALDVGLSGVRFCLVIFAITLTQDLVGREIDRHSVVLSLSYPVPRSSYLLGRYCGVLALTAGAAVILGLLLWLAVLLAGHGYTQSSGLLLGGPYFATIAAVWLDVAVVSAFTLWIASLSTVSLLPLATGALFAIAGRALGPVADFVLTGADGQQDLVASYGPILGVIRWLIPDLSRLDWRLWPMYGQEPDGLGMVLGLISSVVYLIGLLGLAVHVFSRREFS